MPNANFKEKGTMKKYDTPSFMVYAFVRDEGSYKSLFVDIVNLRCDFWDDIGMSDIKAEQRCKNRKCEVSEQAFDMLVKICSEYMNVMYFSADESFEHRQLAQEHFKEAEKAKPCIPAQKVWQAIRCELPYKEMEQVSDFDYRYEKGDYFDLDCWLDMIRRYQQGKFSSKYFELWCKILMRCLKRYMANVAGKRTQLYSELLLVIYDVSCYLNDTDVLPEKVVGAVTARLKWYNHLLQNINNHKESDFEKNGVVVYTTEGFRLGMGNDNIDYLCIVDKVNKRVNYKLVKNYIFNDNVNYSFITKVEFDHLSEGFWWYTLEETLDENAQCKPSVDVD